MSVDSLRIEDIFRGTEAEVVNHFSNKNKTIQQLQSAVGTLAVSTDTNRVMIFTGPTTSGTHTRGDFSWNTFSTNTTYTLDDSVVAQYNPLMWFDASHVSNEYLGGGEGMLRDAVRSYDISEVATTRPLNLNPNWTGNNGIDYNYGDWHTQSFYAPSWNSYPGGIGYQYGIKVNSNKFFRQHNDMSMWMSVATGSDHGISQNNLGINSGFYFHPNGSNPTKIEDRAAVVPAGYKVNQTVYGLNWNGTGHGKIVHRDGHKYLRTGTAVNTNGPIADCSFLAESGQAYPFGATCFQIARKAPNYNGAPIPMISKARYGNSLLEMKGNGPNASTMGASVAGSFNESTGQGFHTWRSQSQYSTGNNHFYWQKSTGNKTSNFGGSSYIPAWGYYPSSRALIHDTSMGGGAGVGTVTYDYNSFKAEIAANNFANLEGNIVEIDNNNMPDNMLIQHGDTPPGGTENYGGSTIPNDWHVLASGNKPIGWQTFYVPKWNDVQMRVFPYGGAIEQNGSWSEERLNGFGQTKYRNDYQSYMLRPSIDQGHGFDGAGFSSNTRSAGKHMFDQNKDSGLLWELGNVNGLYAGRLGQSSAQGASQNHNLAMDVAETIIVPTPGTFSAYQAMCANIEGYLAAKYNIQQDCSLNVPA